MRNHQAAQEPDVPPSRWETLIMWVFAGYVALWILALFDQVDLQIKSGPSDATSGAQWNAGLCLLGLVALTTYFVRRRWLLRIWWKLILLAAIYVWLIATTYDSFANALQVPLLPTLEQLAPGLVLMVHSLLPVFASVATLISLMRSRHNPTTPPRLPPTV